MPQAPCQTKEASACRDISHPASTNELARRCAVPRCLLVPKLLPPQGAVSALPPTMLPTSGRPGPLWAGLAPLVDPTPYLLVRVLWQWGIPSSYGRICPSIRSSDVGSVRDHGHGAQGAYLGSPTSPLCLQSPHPWKQKRYPVHHNFVPS